MMSCNGNSEAEKAQQEADRMIAEAMEKAAKLQAEAEANAKVLTEEAESKALKNIEDTKLARQQEAETKNQQTSFVHIANKSLSKYNGLYVNDNHSNKGALIFVDGKLAFFDLKDFESTYKNEEYIIKDVTEDGLFNITGKYYKDRKGKVYLKETILKEGKPKIVNSECVSIDRLGNVFNRYNSFKELAQSKVNWNYPLEKIKADVKSKYNRSESEIEKALNRTDFYKCDAFTNAEFYGSRIPMYDILDSIIDMN